MDLGDIPLFSMLRGRLGYLSQRQQVIAENVANSDTPRYRPEDLKPFSFSVQLAASQGASAPAATQRGHMVGTAGAAKAYKTFKTRDSETTLDGNSVVLEEEMLKMGESRTNYDAAISFYQRSLGLLKMAVRAPGRGA